MPAKFFCNKMKVGTIWALVPAHDSDLEAIKKLPANQPITVSVTRIRNVDHHRKYFALLNYAFDVWEPPEGDPAMLGVQKNFDTFRKNIAVKAGFYEMHYTLAGTIRIEAKSISFTSMDQDEFEKLYDKTIDVLLNMVPQLTNHTDDELRAVVDQLMEFDS